LEHFLELIVKQTNPGSKDANSQSSKVVFNTLLELYLRDDNNSTMNATMVAPEPAPEVDKDRRKRALDLLKFNDVRERKKERERKER
jgi:hypothetical protein